mgnify:CR=1 FL=1
MNNDIMKHYEKMYKIRRFEEMLLKLFSENKLQGTTHTCIGQEANAVAVMNHIRDEDFVFSSHRCHGQFIAYSGNIKILLSEIMGKQTGMCKGRGGSQHICYRHFYTNGVQGGIVPDATGIALANKLTGKKESIVVAFLGDGTLGQGVVYESFNLAALYSIPILYVVEDNGYAMSTKAHEGVAGSMTARAEAFGIKTGEVTSNDVVVLDQIMEEAFEYVRVTGRPFCQVIHTYRLGPHSKGDDFRDLSEISEWSKKDPLKIAEERLDRDIVTKIKKEVEEELKEAIFEADRAQVDNEEEIYLEKWNAGETGSLLNHENIRCVESLNAGLRESMNNCDNIFLLGEDIRDPYGGAFKATKGLTAQFSDRIMNTPISEAGVLGLSIGMAMGGIRPVVEIMFGDFITLGFDQLLNHATKYNWMYAGQIKVPILLRIPMGGGRGYGATHSQSLEKYLVGIPNLRVLALSKIHNVQALVSRILNDMESPTILIENKKMYGEKLYIEKAGKINMFHVTESEDSFPVYRLTLDEEEVPDVTIITYGSGVDMAMEAAKELMLGDELLVNIIVHTCLSPYSTRAMLEYIGDCKNIVSLEEGTLRNGWGAEIISYLTECLYGRRYGRIAAENCVIPCGVELERKVLPDKDKIIREVRRMTNE